MLVLRRGPRYPHRQRTTPPKVYKHKAGAWEEKPPARPAADVWTAEDEMPAESVAPSRSPTRYSQRANSRDTRDPLQFEPLEVRFGRGFARLTVSCITFRSCGGMQWSGRADTPILWWPFFGGVLRARWKSWC